MWMENDHGSFILDMTFTLLKFIAIVTSKMISLTRRIKKCIAPVGVAFTIMGITLLILGGKAIPESVCYVIKRKVVSHVTNVAIEVFTCIGV